MKTKIYYVMDTMCGWCYGFSDVIKQTYEKYKNDFDFTILPAGMWVGENAKTMNSKLGNFISTHNQTITQTTGKAFGEKFEKNILQNPKAILDSLPGAKAIAVIQTLKPESTFAYLKLVQQAFYDQGQDTNGWEMYADLAVEFGIAQEIFKSEYFAEKNTQTVNDYFALAVQLGVEVYPSVVVVTADKTNIISEGHMPLNQLELILDKYI